MRQTDVVERVRLALWIGVLALAVAVMVAVGHGALAAPDLLHPSTWGQWARDRAPADAVMAVLRLLVLFLAGYLLVATGLAFVLRVGRAGRLVTVADVFTLPFVRSVVQGALGVGIASAAMAGVVAHPGGAAAPTSADAAIVTDDGSPPPTIAPADPVPAAPIHSGHADSRIPSVAVTRTNTWTVVPGDHLWSIAERALATAWGRAPTEDEVVPYWQALIDENRHAFADPQNPDLIYAGQVFTLPAPLRSGA
jgi:hypothetical protein